MKRRLFYALVILTSFSFFTADVKAASYERLFYYRNGPNATISLAQHAGSIDILAPQTYHVDGQGNLQSDFQPFILKITDRYNIKVMPILTNGAFDQKSLEALLRNPLQQDTLIAQLITEAQKNHFYGWQIDFEQMDISYRDQFTAFVKKTHEAFAAHNLKLSVAVIAQISSKPEDYPKNLWTKLIGVYDYAALAANSDFISIMSYDAPQSPGPVAPLAWMQKVIAFSLQHIPKEKLSLGIPLYYWKWNGANGKLVSIGGDEGIQTALKRKGIEKGYDVEQHAPYISYKDKGVYYTVWYENARSVKEKVDLIKKDKLRGFSAWALGLEGSDVYSAMK